MKAVGCDLYNFALTDGVACALNANTCLSGNHAGPSVLIEKEATPPRIRVVGVLASSNGNAEVTDGRISPTVMARAGTGGNQLPLVAYRIEKNESYTDRPEPDGREIHAEP